jgi:phosphopantothenoylcysteine synthetase/decarboxylase
MVFQTNITDHITSLSTVSLQRTSTVLLKQMASSPPSGRRVLLGITGSVAAVKGPELCLALLAKGYDVKVLLTQGGSNFWNKAADYDATSWKTLQEQVHIIIHCTY